MSQATVAGAPPVNRLVSVSGHRYPEIPNTSLAPQSSPLYGNKQIEATWDTFFKFTAASGDANVKFEGTLSALVVGKVPEPASFG